MNLMPSQFVAARFGRQWNSSLQWLIQAMLSAPSAKYDAK
jgi:hypothetical protein